MEKQKYDYNKLYHQDLILYHVLYWPQTRWNQKTKSLYEFLVIHNSHKFEIIKPQKCQTNAWIRVTHLFALHIRDRKWPCYSNEAGLTGWAIMATKFWPQGSGDIFRALVFILVELSAINPLSPIKLWPSPYPLGFDYFLNTNN